MSLASCPKCWMEICECGEAYKDWSIYKKARLAAVLLGLIGGEESEEYKLAREVRRWEQALSIYPNVMNRRHPGGSYRSWDVNQDTVQKKVFVQFRICGPAAGSGGPIIYKTCYTLEDAEDEIKTVLGININASEHSKGPSNHGPGSRS